MIPSKIEHHAERGASLIDYAILVALISIVCVVAIQSLGQELAMSLSDSASKVAGASGAFE